MASRISLLLLVACIAGAFAGDVIEVNRQQREFDYFALSLQWPGTYCRGTRHCCSKNACCRGANTPTHFTIHGLWPDYNDGSWPSCCYRSAFNEKEISTLMDGLEKYWPSLSCGSPSSCYGGKGSFWGHERNMELYNVTDVLREAGYVASKSEKYPLGGIVTAIQNAFHITPEVVCKKDAIDELRICFYKDFKPRDCVGSKDVTSKKSCPKYVSLPEYTPLEGEAMVLKMPTDREAL
ncbi:Ribonuclease 2 [Cardamine amara subsp. amara]|uniref:Ribonuclease 2 n=1 Tax=Cardamine amara subsp. amara TaxID=228776 RepID=A0ABD1BKT6_CARAN